MNQINIFWFRRDFRLEDNHGLFRALSEDLPVLPIFIFDTNILASLPKDDARVSFIYQQLQYVQSQLTNSNKGLQVFTGKPLEIYEQLIEHYSINTVFLNRDYEPYAQERDKAVYDLLQANGVQMKGFKDHVIAEKSEILTQANKPYTVFTPYSKKWKAAIDETTFQSFQSEQLLNKLVDVQPQFPSLEEIGFTQSNIRVPNFQLNEKTLTEYKKNRDFPAIEGTSKLSPHLRFGTISVRAVCRFAQSISESFLNEIIWRDFYSQVLYHFPKVVNTNFNKNYDQLKWENNEEHFNAWCAGKTGYPLVDAGMRQLNQTGWMHNRVRMVVASFLCKHLLIDWRWGEAYFAEKLLDFDLASNNGGWQWAASTGTDAAPYFRIFNPTSQLEKFDKNLEYVKKYVPEYGTNNYPKPIVEHKFARERALERYKQARNAVL